MSDVTGQPADTSAALELVVAAVPGVDEVYRARPTIGAVATHLRRITAERSIVPVPRVVIEDDVVRVTIGTDGTSPAPAVAHAVHDAVLAETARLGLAVLRVDVTVARVG